MTLQPPIAIVGDGVAALVTFGVLQHAGIPAEEMAIYGNSSDPLANFEGLARAIGQDRMRSESNGHLAPVDFPGLALTEAWRRRTPWPLIASLFDAYTPSLDLVLEHSRSVAKRLGFGQQKVPTRVGRIRRVEHPTPAFALFDEANQLLGTPQHIILTLGLPGLAWPTAVESWRNHPRVSHAYHAPEFRAGERVVILGGGMTAAHLWLVALKAGAQVTALCLYPPRHRPLNAPRYYFSTAGTEEYRQWELPQRLSFLADLGQGSIPWRADWEWRLWRARRAGRFNIRIGKLERVQQGQAESLTLHLTDGSLIEGERLVCSTGLQHHLHAHPLLAQLIADYPLPMSGGHLLVADDFTLPPLSRPESLCLVVGSLARYALPVSETFFGMKYTARRIAPLLRLRPSFPGAHHSLKKEARGVTAYPAME
jgi:hypothetical protein